MGVKGLLGICKRNLEIAEQIDLFAKGRNSEDGIELLVDYNNFLFNIVEYAHNDIKSQYPDWQLIGCLGGQYEDIAEAAKKFITRLIDNKIYPVFFADGARGGDPKHFQSKLTTWIFRLDKYIGNNKAIFDYLESSEQNAPDNVTKLDAAEMAMLVHDQVKAVIQRNRNARFVCCHSEADSEMARYLVDTPKAFAIYGYDSDFCVFKDCRFIIDIEEAFDFNHLMSEPVPNQFFIRLWTVQNTIDSLKLDDHRQLVDVSVLTGNDFSDCFHKQIWKIGRGNRIWVQFIVPKYREEFDTTMPIEENGHIKSLIEREPELMQAIKLSRKMYNLETLSESYDEETLSALTKYILEKTLTDELPKKTLALHNGLDWDILLFQAPPHDIRVWCEPLLSVLGAMCSNKTEIEVYGRTQDQTVKVTCAREDWIPKVDKISQLITQTEDYGKTMFHRIVMGSEKNGLFEEFDAGVAFVIYTIKYLSDLHRIHGVSIEKWEKAALVQTALRSDPRNQLANAITPPRAWQKPTARCITLANWYQYTLQIMNILAVFLQIEGFPEPKKCFDGMYFCSLYMAKQKGGVGSLDESVERTLNSIG